MKNFSCSYPRLYERGGFYEGAQTAAAFIDIAPHCRWVATVYDAYAYDRPAPAHVFSRDAAFRAELFALGSEWNATYAAGARSELFALEDGLLFNRCLYKAAGGEIVQMYETSRPGEREWRPDLDPAVDLRAIKQPHSAESEFFYLGSVGSENYGHWLIDDLTRAKALLTQFAPDRLPSIVLNAYYPLIDAIRAQSLRLLAGPDLEIHFIDYRSAYFFPRLFYVSPSSFHPFLKSPAAAAFLRDHFVAAAAIAPRASGGGAQPGKHLFVTRRALWRNVVNLAEVSDYFRALSFEIVELDGLSFIDQVHTFAAAEIIVGVMGAGMTNAVFSAPGAQVVHLAPRGWKDPFFWDLSAVKEQRYAVVFGEPLRPEAPSFSSFAIELSALDAVKKWLS